MATRRQSWNSLYDQIQVLSLGGAFVPAPPVTDRDLYEVGIRLGAPLPPSYWAFMKRFGAGELEYRICFEPIVFQILAGDARGIVESTLQHRVRFTLEEESYPDWLGRAVFFGDNGAGDYFVWDVEDQHAIKGRESPIYLVRYWECEPQQVAGSFEEFIRNTLDEVRESREREPKKYGDPKGKFAYWPLFLRMKQESKKRDITRWLAFNHNAVRDIARAIRIEKRSEAFPILADALEEAGCTNVDLIDSCRKGDPEADGEWVLRVLLGE